MPPVVRDFLEELAELGRGYLAQRRQVQPVAPVVASGCRPSPESLSFGRVGFVSVPTAAKRLGISRQAMLKRCQDGKVPGAEQDPHSHRWRVPDEEAS